MFLHVLRPLLGRDLLQPLVHLRPRPQRRPGHLDLNLGKAMDCHKSSTMMLEIRSRLFVRLGGFFDELRRESFGVLGDGGFSDIDRGERRQEPL